MSLCGNIDLDIATRAWIALLVRSGGACSYATKRAVDRRLVRPLKSSGLWPAVKRLNPCAGYNLSASLVPLVNLVGGTLDTNVNLTSSDYDEALGWQTDGTTKRLDTGYTPPGDATGGISCYLRTTQPSDTTAYTPIGCRDATQANTYRFCANRSNGSSSAGAVNANWGIPQVSVTPNTTGGMVAAFWHTTRTSSTLETLYKNGVNVATSAQVASPGSATVNMYVLCQNAAGTVNNFLTSGSRVAGYALDSGIFSDADSLRFYNIWQSFQTAMGRQV